MTLIKTVKLPRKLKVCFSTPRPTAPMPPSATWDLWQGRTAPLTYTVPEVSATTPRWAFWWQRALRAARFFIISVPWWICSPPTAITRTEPKQEPATCRMFWATSMQKNSRRNWTLSLPAASTWTFRRRRFQQKKCCRKAEADAPMHVTKTGDGSTAEGWRVIPQKQEGLYAVAYHPIGGCPNPDKLVEIYDAIKDMDQAELRVAPTRPCTSSTALAVKQRKSSISPMTAHPISLRHRWPASAHPSARWA